MSSDCRISADASLISDSRAILSNKSRCPAFHPGRAVCARAVSHRPPSLLALPGSDPSGIEPGSGPARSFAMLSPLRPSRYADMDVLDVTLALTHCMWAQIRPPGDILDRRH